MNISKLTPDKTFQTVQNVPLNKDHLSTVTTVVWSMDHLSDPGTPLNKDHCGLV